MKRPIEAVDISRPRRWVDSLRLGMLRGAYSVAFAIIQEKASFTPSEPPSSRDLVGFTTRVRQKSPLPSMYKTAVSRCTS
jgi:hypothetical protein